MTKSRGLIRGRWKPTDDQVEAVRRDYANTKTGDLAQRFGVTYHQIGRLARRLKLAKSQEFFNGPDGNRTDGTQGMGTRFQKGLVPWTKGKQLGSAWGRATRGERSHTWRRSVSISPHWRIFAPRQPRPARSA